MTRSFLALVLIFCLMLLTNTACSSGTTDAPTVEEVQENAKLVKFRLESGRILNCIFYSAKGHAGDESYSWLVLDCDWASISSR